MGFFVCLFTRLCDYHHYVSKIFSLLPKEILYHLEATPHLLPQPLAITNLPSVSVNFPFLNIPYKWIYYVAF